MTHLTQLFAQAFCIGAPDEVQCGTDAKHGATQFVGVLRYSVLLIRDSKICEFTGGAEMHRPHGHGHITEFIRANLSVIAARKTDTWLWETRQ